MNLKTIFRYPGGKTKLVQNIMSCIRNTMDSMLDTDFTFVDVFVGGGSISLGVVNNFPNAKIVVNDIDEYIYAFWKVMCTQESLQELLSYISQYKNPTIKNFNALREESKHGNLDIAEKAFLSIFFNRTTFSGIFKSGPIGGFDQSGDYKIGCRYNASKMASMVGLISDKLSSMKAECFCEDYLTIINRYKNNENIILYLDPPYMKQGKQLYNYYMRPQEYITMAETLKICRARWLVSHDNYPDFVKLFKDWADIKTIDGVPYTINSIKGKRREELIITKRK